MMTTTYTLDSLTPAGTHRETTVIYDPNQPYTVGIAALGVIESNRSLRGPVLQAGDPLTILVATAGNGAQLGDIYAAVFLPGATSFFTFTGINQLSPPNTILPLALGVPLDNRTYTLLIAPDLPAGLPRGTYLLLTAIGPPGANILQSRFFLAAADFTFE
jgi:hypothetical protein